MNEKDFLKYLGKKIDVKFYSGRFEDNTKIVIGVDGYRLENYNHPNNYEIVHPTEIKIIVEKEDHIF